MGDLLADLIDIYNGGSSFALLTASGNKAHVRCRIDVSRGVLNYANAINFCAWGGKAYAVLPDRAYPFLDG